MGRKKLPPDLDRNKKAFSRVTTAEIELIRAAAEIEGKSVSDAIRDVMTAWARRIVRKSERESGGG